MATKKQNNKGTKKIIKTAKKVYKKNKNKKGVSVFFVFVLIIIIIIVGVTVFMFNQEKKNYDSFYNTFNQYADELDFNIIDEDINLPTKYKDYSLSWESSNTDIISLSGKVNKPTYKEGDKKITLKLKATYEGKTFMFGLFSNMVSFNNFEKSFDCIVKAKEATPADYVEMIFNSLYLPSEIYGSFNINNNTCYPNCYIDYESSNQAILSNDGIIQIPENDCDVTLNVRVYVKDSGTKEIIYSSNREYTIKIKSEAFEFYEIDANFNSSDETRKYSDLNIEDLIIHNGMIVNKNNSEEEINQLLLEGETNEFPREIKLRTNNKDENGIANIIFDINNGKNLSFDYLFDDNNHNTNKSYLSIYKINGEDENLIDKIVVPVISEFSHYYINLDNFNGKIKIEFSHDWTNESFVRIDNIKVTRNIQKSDLEDIKIPLVTNGSILLPFTTKYGGSVSWSSSDVNIMNNDGKVNDALKDNAKVILTAHIVYGEIDFSEGFEISININSINKDSLEIYFIDLGVYGLADCGESTYIKYNDIDILVDGGDHFEATNKAVSLCFDSHTNDSVIDYLIITHPDSDHIGGLPYIFNTYQVNNVYKFAGENFTTQKFKNLKNSYDNEPNCNVYDIYNDVFNGNVDTKIILSDDIYIEFIDTGYLLDKETNGRSVVFELFAYDTKVLMTGDADNGGSHSKLEIDYASKVGDIDILKVCHHGTENGTSSYFLNITKPEVAVICNGNYLGNKHGHPNKGPLLRMDEFSKDLKIYAITGGGVNATATSSYAYRGECSLEESLIDRNGTILCKIDNNGYEFSSFYKDKIMDLRESTYWSILFN